MVHLGLKSKNSQFPVQSTNPHLLTVPSCFVFHFHGCASELCAKGSLRRTRGLICSPGVVSLKVVGVDRASCSPNLRRCWRFGKEGTVERAL